MHLLKFLAPWYLFLVKCQSYISKSTVSMCHPVRRVSRDRSWRWHHDYLHHLLVRSFFFFSYEHNLNIVWNYAVNNLYLPVKHPVWKILKHHSDSSNLATSHHSGSSFAKDLLVFPQNTKRTKKLAEKKRAAAVGRWLAQCHGDVLLLKR